MLIRALLVSSLLGLAALPAASAAPVAARAGYVVTLNGFNVANLDVGFTDDGSRYSLDLAGNVAGLGQLVARGTARVETAGRSGGASLAAERFMLETTTSGDTFRVTVGYAGGNVSAFVVEPPLVETGERVPIERSHLNSVGDALSSFILKGGLDAKLCQRQMRIFTGLERFDVAMGFVQDDVATSRRTGYQGPVVLCNVHYTPVSGHYVDSEMTRYLAQSDRILLWYAPVGETGYAIPYRLLMTTGMGDLSVVLTSLDY